MRTTINKEYKSESGFTRLNQACEFGREYTGWYFRAENVRRDKFIACNQTFKAYTGKTKRKHPGTILEKVNPDKDKSLWRSG